MLLLHIFTDLLSKKSLSGAVSEPFALLCFGIALFSLTAVLRVLFNRQEKNAERLFRKLNELVVVRKNLGEE